jgi:hypothetical protein
MPVHRSPSLFQKPVDVTAFSHFGTTLSLFHSPSGISSTMSPASMARGEEDNIPRIVSNDEDDSKEQPQWEPLQDADKMAYLIRYETMVRQQEAEDMAVQAHLLPCIYRLMELTSSTAPSTQGNTRLLQQSVSYAQLQQAWQKLPPTDPMTTDRQWMMLLRLLTQKGAAETESITWAELIQAYKICILGMIALQHLPKGSSERGRARDRSLALLSLFEAPSTHLFANNNEINGMMNAPVQPTRRRRRKWLKKRTQRALPYFGMVALVLLLLAGGFLYQEYRPPTSLDVCLLTKRPSLPSRTNTPTRSFLFAAQEEEATKEMVQGRRSYHPLLGVWSNFS